VKIAMVVSEFNFDVTSAMEERARRHAAFLGVEVSHVVHVPGVFDMGLAVKKLLRRKDVDAVVIIGTVIKGDTTSWSPTPPRARPPTWRCSSTSRSRSG
jgi:6,7-dimethyl-8-ribityllumazine synthase